MQERQIRSFWYGLFRYDYCSFATQTNTFVADLAK